MTERLGYSITLNLKNMGDHHDLYSTTDVLLLTDIFENFKDLCLNKYGFRPSTWLYIA